MIQLTFIDTTDLSREPKICENVLIKQCTKLPTKILLQMRSVHLWLCMDLFLWTFFMEPLTEGGSDLKTWCSHIGLVDSSGSTIKELEVETISSSVPGMKQDVDTK